MASVRTYSNFYVNGIEQKVSGVKCQWMLADFLRVELQLCGTKIVCAEGDCGACTVLRWHPYPKKTLAAAKFQAINSCIATVAQMDGSSLVTVEGLKQANLGQLTSVQSAMVNCHGSQCGYCTPGFVMALTALAERRIAQKRTEPIRRQEAMNSLTGNLCRCTGYEPIVTAAQEIQLANYPSLIRTYLTAAIRKKLSDIVETPLEISDFQFKYFAPTQSGGASKLLAQNRECRILASGTDLGVQLNKKKTDIKVAINFRNIAKSYEVSRIEKNRIRVGCSVSIAELRREVETEIPELARFLDLFASPQIKNLATLVGNVANASPIADTAPFLLVSHAVLYIESAGKKRSLPISQFYLGYKKINLKPGEWISAIEFDIPSKNEKLLLAKVSQRRDLDISCINFAFRISFKGQTSTIATAQLAVGGVGPIPLRLSASEKGMIGKELDSAMIASIINTAQREINPISDLRGSAAFRRVAFNHSLSQFLEKYSKTHGTEFSS